MLDLGGLFLAAFLAATLLPAGSELALAAIVAAGRHAPLLPVAVATLGNVLGSVVNWALGRGLAGAAQRRRFGLPQRHLERAERFYRRYGVWTLLLAWLPVVGDPLTFVAGALKAPFGLFLLLVTLGKGGRYVVVALIAGGG